MKNRRKILSLFMFLAAIACFGIAMRLRWKKANFDISIGLLSEKVDQKSACRLTFISVSLLE